MIIACRQLPSMMTQHAGRPNLPILVLFTIEEEEEDRSA